MMAEVDQQNATPRTWLEWAREGSRYMVRAVDSVSDEELSEPTLLPGWSRNMLIAHLGYNALAVRRLTEWGRTGVENRMYATDRQRQEEIDSGATMSGAELRELVHTAVAQLDAAWEGLDNAAWGAMVVSAQGRDIPVSETAWMRAKEVWVHTIDLDKGGSFRDFPAPMLTDLIDDVQAKWRLRSETPNITIEVTDRPGTAYEHLEIGKGGPLVRATAADMAQWLTGRGYRQLSVLEAPMGVPNIPRWF
ncbi:MAG: maleylpyruvate isomerase family mycothiol-dependent enzyme [Arcanobacterium sp.]|nr:maleylpyruvate isomerase family mycothiol-dependent enzyme [Arcanobacterium sp.]MDY5588857.1 maleylpyruvate isomerase family mycothiol-dependent enzyme [Arcanobacterium sp.]